MDTPSDAPWLISTVVENEAVDGSFGSSCATGSRVVTGSDNPNPSATSPSSATPDDRVTVAGEVVGAVDGPGLVVLLGVTHADGAEQVAWMARKVAELRILREERSAVDVAAPVLLVSQFTLYGDARKGNRPSYVAAARPEQAEPLYDRFADRLGAQRGIFGAMMEVDLVNDGPVTLLLEL